MKRLCEEYILSESVEQALRHLAQANGQARILAGGSDLLLELQQGTRPPVRSLVDVTGIEEMCALEIRGDRLFIGASVTLARIAHSALVEEHARALADAAILMANPQVCNVATIGGNVAHALPAADGTISLLALDAQAEVANAAGRVRIPLNRLFKGPGISVLDPAYDLIVGFYLPIKRKGQASAFTRRVNPQGIALAMLNMAIWLERRDDRIEDIRISIGPAGPVPSRMRETERYLIGQSPNLNVQGKALEVLLKEAHFRTSAHRATSEYRRHLAGILLQEALTSAWERAENV